MIPNWRTFRSTLKPWNKQAWGQVQDQDSQFPTGSGTFVLSGPRGCLKTTRRGAFASSRVTLFNLLTKRSGRGVATGLGASLGQEQSWKNRSECLVSVMWHMKVKQSRFFSGCQSPYLILRTLQALNFPVRWLRTTVNSTSSPVWSSKPSCTSFTWKNNFLLSPTSYVMKPNYDDQSRFRERTMSLAFRRGGRRAPQG